MTVQLAELLDLHLAWQRVRNDFNRSRVFVQHPHEQYLAEENLNAWLEQLDADIRADRYAPSSLIIANVPKAGGSVRPGGCLSIRDQVVYTACIGACLARIREALNWDNETVDFSYPLADDLSQPDWLRSPFQLWRNFADRSIERIDDGYQYVLMADIAGYYELVDISLLASDLRVLGIENAIVQQLSACLNRWSVAGIPGRGFPQGFSASDILGRLYLNSVDRALRERGFLHYRYVDDFRLFAYTKRDALRGFAELVVLLRRRGLVLQGAKSQVYEADEARSRILGVQPVLQTILGQFVDQIETIFGISDPYFSLWEAEQVLAANPNDTPIEVLRAAYRDNSMLGMADAFDKTLFRFLLNRLGSHADRFAFPHACNVLTSHPEETDIVLRYGSRIATMAEMEPILLSLMRADSAIYPYQLYQIIGWRTSQNAVPSLDFLAFVRDLVFERSVPTYLRSTCREFLAKFGSVADLERLEEAFEGAASDLEKAELICCLRRMEIGRRNNVISRVAAEGDLPARAARLVRSGALS